MTDQSYIVRKALPCDLQTVRDMAQVVFRHTYRDILSAEQMEYMMDWMYSIGSLENQLSQGHTYYLAFRNSEPCGYVSLQPEGQDDDGVMVWHLHKIYVMPSEQGRGLGRLLFDRAVLHARTESPSGPLRIELNVNRNNPAVRFYEHLGMKRLRQGDFHIGGGFYMNDYIMGITF